MTELVCSECREPVKEDAKSCPHCGYSPGSEGKWGRGVAQIIGLILTLTVIGAIIGIPIQYLAYKSSKRARNATVGVPA